MIKKYRKKPVVIEAIKYVEGMDNEELKRFMGEAGYGTDESNVFIHTLEGVMQVNHGDYIIKGVKGEFYPCKPDIFEVTYQELEESEEK